MQRLSDTEFEIMEYAWAIKPPFTTAMVMELIGRRRGWRIQTAVTLLGRLMEHGFLRCERAARGRERLFYPPVSQQEYLRLETGEFVTRYHKSSIASLIGSLRGSALTDADLEELSMFVEQARKGGGEDD